MIRSAVCIAALLMTAPLPAQVNCTANPSPCSTGALTIRITIGPAIQLAIAPATTMLTTPTAAHFLAGFAATTGPTATVRANAGWALAINAATSVWSGTDTQSEPARTDKPAGDLRWATSSTGPFTPRSASPVTVASGSATAAATTTIFYQTVYDWAVDTPGAYQLQLVLTITSL